LIHKIKRSVQIDLFVVHKYLWVKFSAMFVNCNLIVDISSFSLIDRYGLFFRLIATVNTSVRMYSY